MSLIELAVCENISMVYFHNVCVQRVKEPVSLPLTCRCQCPPLNFGRCVPTLILFS
jgi:hypothetical protein